MTKYGDKGSCYRGRFLYGITTHNQDNPKTLTQDIEFKFPRKPSPNAKERTYLLKVALYEGIELPDFDEFAVHIACGPYQSTSKVVKN